MERDLVAELAADIEFKRRVADDAFAMAFYALFPNQEWMHEDGSRFGVSWREAGGITAQLRGKGESYVDFYLSDFGGSDEALIKDAATFLTAKGWRKMKDDDRRAYRHRAQARVADLSNVAAGERPAWAKIYNLDGPRIPADPHRAALYRAASAGKLTESEFLRLNRDLVFAPADK